MSNFSFPYQLIMREVKVMSLTRPQLTFMKIRDLQNVKIWGCYERKSHLLQKDSLALAAL